jgi:hypothetical protein
MKGIITIVCLCFFVPSLFAQIAINNAGNSPAASAILDVSSSSKGVLLPRMTSDERKAIPNAEMGLLVYDTDRQTIYLYDGVNWKPMMVTLDNLLPPVSRKPEGGASFGQFGASVDIYGNYAVVGAPNDTANNLNCGAAYIFYKENGTWKQQVKLTASNAAAGDQFGASVSIYNDVVVIGAPIKTISGSAKGRVYVFKRINRVWTQVVGLQASDGLTYDRFGACVAIDGQMIVAGAPGTDYSGKSNAGSAYVFRYDGNNWVQKKILHPSDPVDYGEFGLSVDISGFTVAVGAPGATAGVTASAGAVYTFDNIDFAGTNWVSGQKLLPDVIQAFMDFGAAVDIAGDRILAGAPRFDLSGVVSTGTAFQYKRTSGVWANSLSLTSSVAYDRAGAAVAMDGENLLFSYPGWQDSQVRVMYVPAASGASVKYFYDEDKDAKRLFGGAIAVHNGQYIIGTPGSANNNTVFFGVID